MTSIPTESGNGLRFVAQFYNRITNVLADPTGVAFSWGIAGTTPTVTMFGDGLIVKDGVGEYHIDVPTVGLVPSGSNAQMVGQWDGEGGDDSPELAATGSVSYPLSAPPFPSPFD